METTEQFRTSFGKLLKVLRFKFYLDIDKMGSRMRCKMQMGMIDLFRTPPVVSVLTKLVQTVNNEEYDYVNTQKKRYDLELETDMSSRHHVAF